MIAARRRSARRGSLLIETAMSALMLMIAMTLITKVVASVASERRAWDRRRCATAEAANVMERLSARPFDALATGPVPGLALAPEAARALPGAELKADVVADDPAGGAGSKRIGLQLRWRNRSGGWDAPVRLTTWVHRRKEKS
ncbi:type IV pilus modification PilV family protein [Paludisphaera mucosa]|uniref:Uncharacterized protein n=1 Tax=Paludisphaera mucosa TaxID=3030827 RepID=A0ABT6F8Z7_9BACT|nr:hypothetical protein [Paludisphaera mucosa]MDG3004019.1 hypothetical protein [Paludisphaera mucosa]